MHSKLDLESLKDKRFIDYISYYINLLSGRRVIGVHTKNEILDMLAPSKISGGVIDYIMSKAVVTGEYRIDFVLNVFHTDFKSNCLDDIAFSWLGKNNSSACIFAWRTIQNIYIYPEAGQEWTGPETIVSISFTPIQQKINGTYFSLRSLCVDEQPSTVSEIRTLIVRYFDRLPISRQQKEHLIFSIRMRYNNSLDRDDVRPWLRANITEQIKWTIQYMKEKVYHMAPPEFDHNSEFIVDDICTFWSILSIENEDRYKHSLSTMKKAWSQKKFRDKNSTKKQYSINMSNDIEHILDQLHSATGENKNQIIESLIRREHSALFANKKKQ